MSGTDWLAVILLVLPFVDWTAVAVLHRAVRRFPGHGTLRERRLVALAIALVTSFFALLALARLGRLPLPNDVVALVLVVLIAGLTLVNLGFLLRYWREAWD